MIAVNDSILTILEGYQQEPGFPFADWTTSHHSLFRLINFWDDIFRQAAGALASDYVAAQEVTQDPFSPVWFVRNGSDTKKIRIWHGLDAGGKPDVAFFWGRYPDLSRPDPGGRSYSTTLEGVYMLEISCDFDRDRVLASAAMLREFTHADTGTAAAQAVLEDSFEDRFRRYFPLPEIAVEDDD